MALHPTRNLRVFLDSSPCPLLPLPGGEVLCPQRCQSEPLKHASCLRAASTLWQARRTKLKSGWWWLLPSNPLQSGAQSIAVSLRLGGSASGSPGAFSPYTSPPPQDSVSRRCLERYGLLHAPAHMLPALEAPRPLVGSQTAVSVCHAADAACRDSPASCLLPCYYEPLRVSTLPGYPGSPRAWPEPRCRAERAPASTSSGDGG